MSIFMMYYIIKDLDFVDLYIVWGPVKKIEKAKWLFHFSYIIFASDMWCAKQHARLSCF